MDDISSKDAAAVFRDRGRDPRILMGETMVSSWATGRIGAEMAILQASASELLSEFRWANRIVIIYADQRFPPESGLAAEQVSLIDDAGYAERDLIVLYGAAGERLMSLSFGVSGRRRTDLAIATKDLQNRFEAGEGPFTAILVGKDGTEKHRSTMPIPSLELFAKIDAMPMRRREMIGNTKSR